jgi:capsular exopolysaccharide synthesis family protein
MLAKSGAPPTVILITSAIPGEGKTTLSQNLAASFVQTGKRALLIEADMRRPILRTFWGLPSRTGLSFLLAGESSNETIVVHPRLPRLSLLPAGSVPPYPSELLESDRMSDLLRKLRKDFDVIVIDGAPILPVADSRVLNEMADVTVQVVRQGMTTKTSLKRAHDLLSGCPKNSVGIVLNGVDRASTAYDSYYGYKAFTYCEREVNHEST